MGMPPSMLVPSPRGPRHTGQSSARVVRTVAAIPSAKITITHDQTGASRETEANEAGYYSFPTIDTGTYSLTVEFGCA